jgi:dTDP-4-amino-4,6-dideoxygalactose transaminase
LTVSFLDLGRHVRAIQNEVEGSISRVLDSAAFVDGPAVAEFEEAFARYCGAAYAVGVASGTDAIEIALRVVGIGLGDQVLVPANTCVPTVAGIQATGADPVLVDVESDTCTIDPSKLEASIGPRCRAVVPVHLYGQCADMDAISAIAKRHGLAVVEDAAQAHGATYAGQRAGTLGVAGAFSFYPTKNLGAFGDAGAVVTNDPELAAQARLLRQYGEYGSLGSLRAGGNSRLDTLQAAVLLVKLRHLEAWTEKRRRIAATYLQALTGLDLGLPLEAPDRSHVYHLFVVRSATRDRFRALLAQDGIETLIHYSRPIHGHPAYRHLASHDGRLSVSEKLTSEVVSLPLHPYLTDAEIQAVISAVRGTAQ